MLRGIKYFCLQYTHYKSVICFWFSLKIYVNVPIDLSANLVGHILPRNCRIKHVIEGKTEGIRRRARRRKQLLDNLKEKTRYWNLKEEELDRTLRGTRWETLSTCHKTEYEVSESCRSAHQAWR